MEEFWKATPDYTDFLHELSRHNADNTNTARGPFRWIRTLLHGRSFAFVPIMLSVIWSVVAVYVSMLLKSRVSQVGCKWFCTPLGLGPTTHSYVGFALFLLLGFRVNESHQRYLDGLKIWNTIEGNISTLAKYILQAFPPGTFHAGDRERMLGWLVAFPVALKRELRDERDLCELKNVLAQEDLAELQNAPTGTMPSHALYVLSAYIMKAHNHEKKFSAAFLMGLVNWVKTLDEAADQCVRIRRAPCAFSYVAHLRMFLFLWLFLLPFTLVESTSWGTPGIVAFVTYGVVGVELNAAELENPFGVDYNDIPLSNLCDNIAEAVRNKYRAAQGGCNRYVRAVSPVEPSQGEQFWLEETSAAAAKEE